MAPGSDWLLDYHCELACQSAGFRLKIAGSQVLCIDEE
jgi:hypothetical protein